MKTKFHLFILCLFIFSTSNLIAQTSCLPGGITFTSQAEIDSFPINYPGCAEITGNVIINDAVHQGILNLDSLVQIETIGGNLDIIGNNGLGSLLGLSQLTSVGGFLRLYALNNISTLSGLDQLTSIGGELHIYNNPFLANLTGLEQLTSVKDITIHANRFLSNLSALSNITQLNGFLLLVKNNELTDFHGLHNITTVGKFVRIAKHDGISSLTGLEGITSIGEYLKVDQNDNLLNLEGLENLNHLGGFLTIDENNAMTNLSGLEQLTSVGSRLGVYNCPALTDLHDLAGITHIGTDLTIFNNDLLVNLHGLENITSINGQIYIEENDALTTLSGIENIDYTGINYLYFQNSNTLSYCNLQNICDYLSIPSNQASIYGNASGCDTRSEIETLCMDRDGDGISSGDGDCDDNDPNNFPGNTEVCDGQDNNCDDLIDEGFDQDNDGISDCFDNCPTSSNPSQTDADCDGVGDICDQWPGCDDNADINGNNIPDCIDMDLMTNWPCGNNGSKVTICHIPPGNPNNRHDICVNPNAVSNHLNNHGGYIGECDQFVCNSNGLIIPPGSSIFANISLGDFQISPNPASDFLMLDLRHYLEQNFSISIYNHLGQEVLSLPEQTLHNPVLNIGLNKQELPKGVYLLSVQTTMGMKTKQFIIAR